MKSFKIKSASYNNRKKVLEIVFDGRKLSLPYSRLPLVPDRDNPITALKVDNELGRRALTYGLNDGRSSSVHVEAFLDFCKDPEYVKEVELYELTVRAIDAVESSGMSKREISRRMATSMSQLSRILDPTNYTKTFDQLIKLYTVLGYEVTIRVAKVA